MLCALGLTSRDAYAQTITFGGAGTPPPAAAPTGAAPAATPPAAVAPAATPPAAVAPAAAPAARSAGGNYRLGRGGEPAAPATKPASAAPEGPKAPEAAAAEDEWTGRDAQLNESSTLVGGSGLMYTQHAQGNAAGQFRLGFTTEFFSSGFLCTAEFPCKNKSPGSAPVTSDSMHHIGGTINLGVGITSWLEGYASTGAYANSDDVNRPSLLQVLGDTAFGFKGYGKVANTFHAGGFAELLLVNGTGAVGLAGPATGARFGAIATEDLRELRPGSNIPLRLSLNLAYSVDNSGAVVEDTESARGTAGRPQPVTRIERFGLQVNRVDHFDWTLGAETFFADDKVRPFIEYRMLAPVNRQGYLCKPDNPSKDHCLANDAVAPSNLTIGGRFFPWKRGFGLTAALSIGVTGTSDFIEEMSPMAPWTLFLGAGWNVDTQDRPPVEKLVTREVKVEGKVAARGHIKGNIHEKDKTDEIPNAIVAWENHPEIESLHTGNDGRFVTQELAEGKYTFAIKADGYKDGVCEAALPKGGQDAQVDCALEALPRVGTLMGHVRDAETMAAVPSATVVVTDSAGKPLQITADSSGGFRFEGVAPGTAQMQVDADDFLTFVAPADVKVRQEVTVDPVIRHRPKQGLVQIGAKEITIKQQVQFALDQAVILPESTALLSEIADVLIHNVRIKRIEIQGHTDNSGSADHNQTLSDQRADAVRAWLTSHGVTPDRLVAKGFGQSKPLVPNVTPAMKAKNRRVQFIILEQDAAAAGVDATAPKKAAPPPF